MVLFRLSNRIKTVAKSEYVLDMARNNEFNRDRIHLCSVVQLFARISLVAEATSTEGFQ